MADSGACTTGQPSTQARVGVECAMETRPIPRTGEPLPIVGMGTWQTFDRGPRDQARLVEVTKHFFAAGGRLIDSSPMYGRAEETVGDVVTTVAGARPFLATKVWTRGREQGIAEMERSMRRMRTRQIDLMQIHNLLDWRTHLPVLRQWKGEQ